MAASIASPAGSLARWRRMPGGRAGIVHRQRGWLGLIGLLIALVIVAVLAQKVLKTHGLLSAAEPARAAAERGPGEVGSAPMDATVVAPSPTAAIERARGLENAVQQQANDLNKRMDEAAK